MTAADCKTLSCLPWTWIWSYSFWSSFEGKQVYPKNETKEESFKEATQNQQDAADRARIPEGTYYLDEQIKGFGRITAKMRVENGMFIVEKGAICRPSKAAWVPVALRGAPIRDNVLLEDVECNSPSTTAWIPTGRASYGWIIWKCEDGRPINIFRAKAAE